MPGQLVHDFITHIERGDMEAAYAMLSDDVEYDNVPVRKVFGRDAVRASLDPFRARYDEVVWEVLHQVANGDLTNGVVMNERIDRVRKGDDWAEIALAGLFVVRDGKITLWRDYFDRAQFEASYRK